MINLSKLLCVVAIAILTHSAVLSGQAPYPASKLIKSIEWEDTTRVIRMAHGSDNFPLTWAEDGNLYTTWGDGTGFNSPHRRSMGFARISGIPPNISALDIRSLDEQCGDGSRGKKGWGLICVDSVLYLWMGHADNDGAQAQLAWSRDHMKSWTFVEWKFSEFGLVGFINYGQNYAGAPDDYVYAYSHDNPVAQNPANRFILMRVLKNNITVRDAYEFFVELDSNNQPVWTKDIEMRGAVFENHDSCLRSAMTYNPGIERYLWWQHIPAPKDSDDRGDTRFEGGFGVYEAPYPWGPWSTAYFTKKWDIGPGEHADFPAKWISKDGRNLYLVFSGDDSFSVRKAVLQLY